MKQYEISSQIIEEIGTFWKFSAIFPNDDGVAKLYSKYLIANLSVVATSISNCCNDRDMSISKQMIPIQIARDLNGWLSTWNRFFEVQFTVSHVENLDFSLTWKTGFSSNHHTIIFKICSREELDNLFKDLS